MYYQTGLPGWVRRGYSPGWGTMPPGAQYLNQTGQLDDAREYFQQNVSAAAEEPGVNASSNEVSELRAEVAELKQQVKNLVEQKS
jgi:polyhydroxyalkanoate synthesis regulator phasin